MHIKEPVNVNYAAQVVRVRKLVALENCDNVVAFPVMGMQAIVGVNTQLEELGVLFPTEAQLSHDFVRHNNLYRHADLNDDPEQTGYMEDNRRVRALKFRGHVSNAFYMPISSLVYTGAPIGELREGDVFDELDGQQVCQKYERPRRYASMRGGHMQAKKDARVEEKLFPEHFTTPFFTRVEVPAGERCMITQKLHGTSIRIGNTLVKRKPTNWLERVAVLLGVRVEEREYTMVYGSRKVIKDANNPDQQHYYGEDLWTHYGHELDSVVPKGYMVYGELIGWTPSGEPLQKNYTYNVPRGKAELYVYRVCTVNPQGITSDLGWEALKEWCEERALKYVPQLFECQSEEVGEFLEQHLDTKFCEHPIMKMDAVPLAAESPCDEGVCIRIEAQTPIILKAKGPKFYEHESKMLDKADVVDMEEVGSDAGQEA